LRSPHLSILMVREACMLRRCVHVIARALLWLAPWRALRPFRVALLGGKAQVLRLRCGDYAVGSEEILLSVAIYRIILVSRDRKAVGLYDARVPRPSP